MMKDYKIAVAGTGYVGLSIAALLFQHHQVDDCSCCNKGTPCSYTVLTK